MPDRAPIRRSANTPTPYRRDALQQRRKTLEKQLIESVLPPDAPGPSNGPDSQHMSKFFKALSDETRQKILGLLEDRECTVGEIVSNFELAQPTISRHLSVLKEANLVVNQRQGQHVVYRLNREALARSMQDFFGQFQQCQQVLR